MKTVAACSLSNGIRVHLQYGTSIVAASGIRD